MKFRSLLMCAVAVLAARAGAAAYEVQPDETLTITDANNTAAAYPDGIAFADNTGLILFNTSSAPVMKVSGAGTIRKISASDWTMTASMSEMTGIFDLSGGGVVSFNRDNAFCGSASGTVVVSNGTTLCFLDTNARLRYARLSIAGSGCGTRGALDFANAAYDNMQLRYVTLTGDARITIGSGCTMYGGNELDLNGHNLTIEGQGTFAHVAEVKGEGNITLSRRTSGTLTWDMAKDATFAASTTSGIYMTGNTKIVQSRAPAKPNRPLHVSGTGNTLAWNDYWNSGNVTTNSVGWAGDIIFADGETTAQLKLEAVAEARFQTFTILGRISGNGKLTFQRYWAYGRFCLAHPENTFTGGIELCDGTLVPLHPGSLSDWSKISVTADGIDPDQANSGEGLEMPLDPEGTTGWTYAKGVELANLGVWTANVYPRFSTELFRKAAPAALVYDATATLASGKYIGSKTPTLLLVPNADSVTPPVWDRGKLILTNAVTLKSTTVNSRWASSFPWDKACLAMENACVTLVPGGRLQIGSTYGGVVSISNAVFTSSDPTKSDYPDHSQDSIALGSYIAERVSGGVLYLDAGAVVSNRLCVGGASASGANTGIGSVFQRGGSVFMSGSSSSASGAGVLGRKSLSHGYYEMRDGTLAAHGLFALGYAGMGVFYMFGGTATFSDTCDGTSFGGIRVGSGNGGSGTLYMTGGTIDMHTSKNLLLNTDYQTPPASHSAISLNGPTAQMSVSESISANEGSDGQTAYVNVSGGATLKARAIYNNAAPGIKNLYLNFDGGTFVTGGSSVDVFRQANAVNVYAGGLTVDTDGKEGNISKRPITGVSTKGVRSVTLSTPFATCVVDATQTTLIGAPRVVIEGDGAGASAVALFDSDTRNVHEIVVTSPGAGYTTATCNVYYCNALIKTFTCDDGSVVLADQANTGSFTKKGAGDFTLAATNTWGGATIVAGGTLKAGCEKAIPDGTDVVLSGGGVLDLNGTSVTLHSVSYGAGGGTIINAGGSNVPAPTEMTIAFDDIVAGRVIAISGDVDLSTVTIHVTGAVPALDAAICHKYGIVTVTDGSCIGTPTIESALLPQGWVFSSGSRGVVLAKPVGALVIFR